MTGLELYLYAAGYAVAVAALANEGWGTARAALVSLAWPLLVPFAVVATIASVIVFVVRE